MESNLCDGNNSDSDAVLPPRKRLLAGFKKGNSDHNSVKPSNSNIKSISDTPIDDFMKYYMENPNLSVDERLEESDREAEEAHQVAAAEEAWQVMAAAKAVAAKKSATKADKSIHAANAIVLAKRKLDVMADFSDKAYSYKRHSKKKKMKNHSPLNKLDKNLGNDENCKTDEELALRLHHAINSSPRITKSTIDDNVKSKENKRVRGETDSEGVVTVSEKISKFTRDNSLNIINVEESTEAKERSSGSSDDLSGVGRKRERMKHKKLLPLSICSSRDLANTDEEMKLKGVIESENNVGKYSPTSMGKCKEFDGPDCVNQNKLMEP